MGGNLLFSIVVTVVGVYVSSRLFSKLVRVVVLDAFRWHKPFSNLSHFDRFMLRLKPP
jgi:hypothetical protein